MKKKYGIKAYGSWEYFSTKSAYKNHLLNWIAGTDGAEQERAIEALTSLEDGYNFCDTDRHIVS